MKIMRNTAARVFAYFIFVLISLVALGGVASAAVPSNGIYIKDHNSVYVPQWVTAPNPNEPYSGRCTDSAGTDWSAGQSAWISTQSGLWFTEQSVNVAAGTTSVPLNLVFANTWCWSSRYNVLGTYNLIESVTATEGATVSGIAANTVIAAGQPSNPYELTPRWEAVAVAAIPFNLNLPANLSPGRHDIVVTLNSGKKINSAQDTKNNTYYYQCVLSGGYPGGVAPSDFAQCGTGPAELVVTINVPQPEIAPSYGKINITKRGYFGNETGAIDELKIGETLQRGQVLISKDRSKKLVMQEDGNLAVYIYHGWVWQAASLGSNRLVFQSNGNLELLKDNADGTATALWSSETSNQGGTVLRMQNDGNLVMYNGAYGSAPAVWYSRMQKYWNGAYTNFGEYAGGTSAPVNSGNYPFDSLANTNSHSATTNEVGTAQVLVSNAYPLNGSSVFHSSQANPSTVDGVWVYTQYRGVPKDGIQPYWTTVQVPESQQVVKAQINSVDKTFTCTGTDNTGTCTLPGLTVSNGATTNVDWWMKPKPQPIPYYPWLQTKNGDVTSANSTSSGKITGQKIGSATDSNFRRGARRAGTGTIAATVAESSFVVAASDATGFGYFCSQERFVLGKPLADRDNFDDGSCNTGGYTPSPVNFDKVRASVSKAYADNGNGVAKSPATPNACNPKYATSAVATAASLNTTLGLGCPTGGIQKIGVQADTVTLSSLSSVLTVNGRGTLWIPGKLVINNDIKYSTTNSTNDPKTTPNLVIFVEGDVEIAPNVLQIDASIVSMKTISTCTQSGTPGPACSSALVINGFLASGGKINFARRYYAEPYATATPSPAELINLTSQSTTFPAPGLDRTDTDVTSKLQINSGELAPRLR